MEYSITALPTDDYCTMPQALKHLRLDVYDGTGALDVDDVTQLEVQTMIDSAIAQVENLCGVVIGPRQFTLMIDAFASKIKFPFYKVTAITAVTYIDVNGDTQTLPNNSYRLSSYTTIHESMVYITGNLPAIKENTQITITGTCGTTTVPDDVKKAVRLLIGDSDTYREDRSIPGTERAVYALLRPYKQ